MRRLILLLGLLCFAWCAAASHAWSKVDLCARYPERLPPGLTAQQLPEPHSTGAGLLQRYCTRCHNLPGPDRHSPAEWRELVPKMFMLMEVANRFGSQKGEIERMSAVEQGVLLAYLQRHAGDSRIDVPPAGIWQRLEPWLGRGVALLPVLLLTLFGLARWRRQIRRDYQACAIDR